MDELWQRRLVREQGNARYDFSHDRIRDVAYAESSPVKRTLFHQRVAQALEQLHAGYLDPIAGELAGHYQCAGMLEQAFRYFRQAATVAEQLYSHREQADYLQKAIATAQQLPQSSVSPATQSTLWYDLGYAHVLVHDWSSELVATAWRKANELATEADALMQRCTTLGSLTILAHNRGEWREAYQLSKLAYSLAKESGKPALINGMSGSLGLILNHLGELPQALEYYQVGLVHGGEDGLTPGTIAHAAQCVWLLGFPAQAVAYAGQALAVSDQNLDVIVRFPRLTFAGMLYSFLRDAPMVRALGEELTTISTKYDFPYFAIEGRILTGWALAQQGDAQTGLRLVQKGVADQGERNIRMFEPFCRSLLAETLALSGELEDALDEVMAALAYAEECGNCYWNAHLLKLKGDFLLALAASAAEVEIWYQQAIATARQQGAKSLELRATTSLCRLWQGLGKQADARPLLAEIYGWFTEGFDTVDLKEAKALLDTL